MAVEVVQLFLHIAADAAAVVSVQPLADHAHAVLPLRLVEGKVFDLGGDATPPPRVALLCDRGPGGPGCPGYLRYVLAAEEEGRQRRVSGS